MHSSSQQLRPNRSTGWTRAPHFMTPTAARENSARLLTSIMTRFWSPTPEP